MTEDGPFEPAERDSAAIRKTVWFLVVVAVASAVIIPLSYVKLLNRQAGQFRPPMEGSLEDNLALKLVDGRVVTLDELFGQVWVAWLYAPPAEGGAWPVVHAARWEALQEMRRDQGHGLGAVQEVVFLLGVGPEELGEEREAEVAEGLRVMGVPGDAWAVCAGSEVVLDYLFSEMRAGLKPEVKAGGWVYDECVIVGDGKSARGQRHHLRGHFDFERAREMDVEAQMGSGGAGYEKMLRERFIRTLQYLQEVESSF